MTIYSKIPSKLGEEKSINMRIYLHVYKTECVKFDTIGKLNTLRQAGFGFLCSFTKLQIYSYFC